MKKKKNNSILHDVPPGKTKKINLPGYPLYPSKDDIYNNAEEDENIDPGDISKIKEPNDTGETANEKDFNEDLAGGDLDVPGAELDDQQESVGSEDEENNYYSIGGDDHNDLEEDRGE